MDDGAIGVKLGGSVAGIVSKLFDQIFVGFTQVVLIDGMDTQRNLAEMLNQISQEMIRQTLFISLLRIAKHTLQTVIIGFNQTQGVLDGIPNIFGGVAYHFPAGF